MQGINLEFFLEHEKSEIALDIQVEYQISSWISKPRLRAMDIDIWESSAYR